MPDLATMESIAVDLGSPRSIDRAKRRRGRKNAISATVKARIDAEIGRAQQRINWLERKALRLPAGSNGRRKAFTEIVVLQHLLLDLQQPPRSRPKQTSYTARGFKHAIKAAELLNEIVPEKGAAPKPKRPASAAKPAEARIWHGPRIGKPNARKSRRTAARRAGKANR